MARYGGSTTAVRESIGPWLAALTFLLGGCEPTWCEDSCTLSQDGICDDGRFGAASGLCGRGTDCSDCGPNHEASPPSSDSDPTGGFGAPVDPDAEPGYEIPLGECGDDEDIGYFCDDDDHTPQPSRCDATLNRRYCSRWYYLLPAGRVCERSTQRSCGFNRRCVTGSDGHAVGCQWEGATGSRVRYCEERGACNDGTVMEFCTEAPALLPIPTPAGGQTGIETWWQLGGERLFTCREPSDVIPGACYWERSEQAYCQDIGADRYCSKESPDYESCLGVDPPDIPSCLEHLDLSLEDGCVEGCVRTLVSCVEAAGCVAAASCISDYSGCVGRC